MKSFIKKKSGKSLGYRTSDFFRANNYNAGGKAPQIKFNPSKFKTQHKG